MTGLREPPKRDQPSRIVARIVMLALLVVVAGTIIWGAVTDQQIDLVESTSLSELDLEDPVVVDGLTINVVEHRGGPIPVVFLHDFDVAGGVVFDDVIPLLPNRFKGITIDLPGFGFSQRMPDTGKQHTVAVLAEVVTDVMAERLSIPAVLVGVGLGGEVAAEIAVTYPDQVRGLVLVDVDFWRQETWVEFAERLPFIGRPVTFTYEGGGRLGLDTWAPECGIGGWCPSSDQKQARHRAASIRRSTDSIRSFRLTLPSSLVPSDLPQITAPIAYVWSTRGAVPEGTVDRLKAAISELLVSEIDAWRAHLEAPGAIAEAVELVSP